MNTDYLVIFNPVANKRRAKHQWPEIKKQLDANDIKYRLKITRRPLHCVSIISHYLVTSFRSDSLPRAIIVIGGDGTVHETIEGIHAAQSKNESIPNVPVLIIPTGANNNFYTHMKQQHNINSNFIEQIKKHHIENHEIGLFDEHIKKQRGIFLNNLGIGLDANVFNLKNNFISHKINLKTRIEYYLSIFPTIYNLSTFPVDIKANGEKHKIKKAFMVTALNHDTDNDIELLVLTRKNIFQLCYVIMRVLFKRELKVKSAFRITSDNIHVEIPSLEYAHADGETLGSRFYDIEYRKAKYPFIY